MSTINALLIMSLQPPPAPPAVALARLLQAHLANANWINPTRTSSILGVTLTMTAPHQDALLAGQEVAAAIATVPGAEARVTASLDHPAVQDALGNLLADGEAWDFQRAEAAETGAIGAMLDGRRYGFLREPEGAGMLIEWATGQRLRLSAAALNDLLRVLLAPPRPPDR